MEPGANFGTGNRICSVVFVDLVRYTEQPVSKQVELKARFGALLAAALEHTPMADRVAVDTGDGAALCFLGDPEDALFAANTLRAGVRDGPAAVELELRLGINLGPVRVVKDINGHSNVIGDGINVAQRVMSFAAPNQILVSRSYYEVVSRLSPEYAQLFNYVGLHRDKHVREHEVYEVQMAPAPREDARPATAAAPGPSPEPPVVEVKRTAGLDPRVVERLTAALAREIGPVAKLIVRRAAARAADPSALAEMLAEQAPEATRERFLAALAELGATPPAAAPPSEAPAPGAQPSPAAAKPREIGPELLARAEQLLTRHIGPLARLLVREAVKRASTPRDLFERLAVHIDDENVRKSFIAEADRPG
jgi:class 3 adenylate cyclase